MIRVVLLDDHALIRRGMRDILGTERDMEVAGEAASHEELRVLLPVTPCDVLVLDINLPGSSGLEVLHELQRQPGAPRALVVSMYPEDQYGVKALRAGAWGYVNKSEDSAVMIEAIRTVARGRKYISPAIAALLVDRLVAPEPAQPHLRLSDRELQMLVMIAQGHRLADISTQLDLTAKTVSVYRARLMEKMKLSTSAELAHYACLHGLLP